MCVLIISEPLGRTANSLVEAGVTNLVCVTPGNIHLRNSSGFVVSGKAIKIPQHVDIHVPEIKRKLLDAYPLIDRWVSNRQSISNTIEELLEYTVSLVQIIGNHPPRFAILETGAPHHLFTYCLDVALNYLGVDLYYLYGNAFDGRCIVFKGSQKEKVVAVTDYSPTVIIENYIDLVLKTANFTPADSTNSLTPWVHRSPLYAFYLGLRHSISRFRHSLFDASLDSSESAIRLNLPYIGLPELISILLRHKRYLKLLQSEGVPSLESIRSNDIVYVGHMVPEATSFPEAPNYPDEIDVLIDLKNRFPDSNIFYREHPAINLFSEFGHIHLQGLHKNPSFYKQLLELRIKIIPASLHISQIRERGCIFATKTGRVAIENSILGFTTIIYGVPFYGCDLPLTCHVSKLEKYSTALELREQIPRFDDPIAVVKNHLLRMFSGSIENYGIGLAPNPNAQASYESDFIELYRKLICR